MPVTIYQYPNCSTCKKALAWAKANAVDFTSIDITKTPPTAAQLANAAKLAGVPVKKLFNVSGESYRNGGFKDKTLTDEQAFAALAADGKLIKRPLAIGETFALVGFDEAAWKAKLKPRAA